MKCQILLSGKNKKNISIGGLLKILPRVLSIDRLIDSRYKCCLMLWFWRYVVNICPCTRKKI